MHVGYNLCYGGLCRSAQLNWCNFLLQELLEACEEIYKRATHLIYGYIVVSLAMWKWCPLEGWELDPITKYQPLTFRYTPKRTSGDPSSKEINVAPFIGWYKKMLEVVKAAERIPNLLLYDYSSEMWFCMIHDNAWIRLQCIHSQTFHMTRQKFMMIAKVFHTEVGSWLGIAGEVQGGKHIYLFEGMVTQPLPGETPTDSRKQLVEEDLQPIIKKL